MKDVKPITCDHVPETPQVPPKPKSICQISHTWDLHGLTLAQAYQLTQAQISHSHSRWRYMTFVTGKSGQINKEFSQWLERNPHVRNIEVTNDGGAYKVWFKSSRQNKK